jgi:hypothetical protein
VSSHDRYRFPLSRRLEIEPTPRSGWLRWDLACAGRISAEELHPLDREDLIWALHEWGMTDRQIAERTRLTTYTTARIRSRLGLAAS